MRDWWKWPWFVTGATWERLQTERNCLAQALVDAQRELAKHKLLLANIRNSDKVTEQAMERIFQQARRT